MSRRGIALLIAVMALGLVSAMVVTAFELARIERRVGAGMVAAAQARAAAEAGLAEAAMGWDPALRPVGPGSSRLISSRSLPTGSLAELWIESTDGPYLLLVGRGVRLGAAGGELGRAEVFQLVRARADSGDTLARPRHIPRGWWRMPP